MIKLFEDYLDSLNEKLQVNILQLKNYLLQPYQKKYNEFKKLFPNKNYNGTPTEEDVKKSLKDGEFKTIRKDTKGKDKVVNRAYPTHYYFEYLNDIPKDRWLIHFSNFGKNIFKDQKFKFGIRDYKYLGYTNRQSKKGKLRGGYNFAYLFRDALKFGLHGNPLSKLNFGNDFIEGESKNKSHYGKEIIIFKANGIKVRTWLNDEAQVVFWGPDAENINLITNVRGKWVIKSKKEKVNLGFFKSFWEEYVKPYKKNKLYFDEDLFDYEDLFAFENLKDVFKFFENDYDKYKKYLN